MAQATGYMENVSGADLRRISRIAGEGLEDSVVEAMVTDVAKSIGTLLDGVSDQGQARAFASATLAATIIADMVAHLERDAWERELGAICSGTDLRDLFAQAGFC